MTKTAVVEIPVDDSAFEKFSAAFGDYQDKLKEQPAVWRETNTRITELARLQQAAGVSADKAWGNATKASQDYEKAIAGATKAQKHLGAGIHGTAAAMKKMATESKAVADHLFGAVRFAAKLGTLGLGGGLIGGGLGLFGLDELAGSVLNTQKGARGLALSSGKLNSFRTNMQYYAGANVLQGAAEARMDPTRAGALATLGISYKQAHGESATTLAGQEIMAVHRAYKQNPSLNTPAYNAFKQLGGDFGDWNRAGLGHGKDIRAAIAAMKRDAGALGWSNQVAREWSAFKIQMDKAGKLIDVALINTLTPLTPQLTRFSKEITNMITGLEKSGDVKKWVNDLASGLGDAARFLGSPQFKQDMRTIAYDFDVMAKKLQWLFGKPSGSPGAPAAPGSPAHPGTAAAAVNNPFNVMRNGKRVSYASEAAGVRAAYKTLESYPSKYHLATVGQELAKFKGPWGGPGDMTKAQYISLITKGAHISPNALMPFNDPGKMAAIMHYQSIAEGHKLNQKQIRKNINAVPDRLGVNARAAMEAERQNMRRQAAEAAKSAHHPANAGAAPAASDPTLGDLAAVLKKLRRQQAQPPTVNLTITNHTAAQVHKSADAAVR